MAKVLYNTDWGSFHIPEAVLKRYCKLTGKEYNPHDVYTDDIPRHDLLLIQAFEEFIEKQKQGNEIPCETDVRIYEIKGNKYIIREYDGIEEVLEPEDIKWIEVND